MQWITGCRCCWWQLGFAWGQIGLSCCRMGELSKADYEALAEFRWSLRHFLGFSEAAARAAGITPQQHQALLAIKGFPGRDKVSVGELAERLQIEHHSAVGLADRLVRRG